MRIYVHIGYPKTGSSAIQSHIFTNQAWLENNGVFIPLTGYSSGLGHAFLAPGNFDELRQELETARERGFSQALVSAEGLFHADPLVIEPLSSALAGYEVVVLAYVRDQVLLYQSSMLQLLENLKHFSGSIFFDEGHLEEDRLANLDFTAGLTKWLEAFAGKLDIRVRIYERSRLRDENVVVDFLGWLGLEVDEGFALDDREINPSLDARAAAMIVAAKSSGANINNILTLRKALFQMSAKASGPKEHFLTQPNADKIRTRFDTSNHQLFDSFRPENALPGETTLLPTTRKLAEDTSNSGKVFDYLRELNRALTAPSLEIWGGSLLVGHKIAKITLPPNTGWRGTEDTGIWSVGQESQVAFLLPKTHAEAGPSALQLVIRGSYFGDNLSTRVTVGGIAHELDLGKANIMIDMDAGIRENGVCVKFEHQYPQRRTATGHEPSDNGIAFKLESATYRFLWEP